MFVFFLSKISFVGVKLFGRNLSFPPSQNTQVKKKFFKLKQRNRDRKKQKSISFRHKFSNQKWRGAVADLIILFDRQLNKINGGWKRVI